MYVCNLGNINCVARNARRNVGFHTVAYFAVNCVFETRYDFIFSRIILLWISQYCYKFSFHSRIP